MHLGILPPRITHPREISFLSVGGVAGYAYWKRGARGAIVFCGRGPAQEKVFLQAVGKNPYLVLKTTRETLALFGEDPATYIFIDCTPGGNAGPGGGKVMPGLTLTQYNLLGEKVLIVKERLRG